MLNGEELPLPSPSDRNVPASVPSETALLEALSHLSSLLPIRATWETFLVLRADIA